MWHFYAGDPLRLVLLHPDGSDEEIVMGSDVLGGQTVQHLVRAGVWQAGELVPGGTWALFCCTTAPGFTPACFEGAHASDLLATHPTCASDIKRLALPAAGETKMPDR